MSEAGPTLVRLRIGNISAALAGKVDVLSARIAKFGTVVGMIDLHTKPVADHYFAFVTVEFRENGFQKLQASLAGAVFMGRKLSIEVAKPDFRQRWLKDHGRPDDKSDARRRQQGIHAARQERIREAHTPLHINRLTGAVVQRPPRTSYLVSAHTVNNIAANTKQTPPTQTLQGDRSYGYITPGKRISGQSTSRLSGGGEYLEGRVRKTPRSKTAMRQQTMRISINGKATQIKAYKTKLWGYEKNRTVNDLTWNYANGVWTSGYNHVLERVEGDKGAEYADTGDEERQKTTSVLASFMSDYDFDRQVELLEDNDEETINGIAKSDILVDSKGRRTVNHFDYEMEGGRPAQENIQPATSEAIEVIELYKQTAAPAKEVYYDEDDESDFDVEALTREEGVTGERGEMEIEPKEEDAVEHNEEVKQEQGEILASGKEEPAENRKQNPEVSEAAEMPNTEEPGQSASHTEALRSLLNPQESTGFKLALSDDDDIEDTVDNTEQAKLMEQIKQKQHESSGGLSARTKTRGLFWPHRESPFLLSQSQLSKFGALIESVRLLGEDMADLDGREGESQFEKWFWSKRGEVARECKRRKRDVARAFRKSSRRAVD